MKEQAWNQQEMRAAWRREEDAYFEGWNFSHLEGRWQETALPWDYRAWVQATRKPTDRLLDMGTGGGEFLLSLGHPPGNTVATEGYPPNIALCEQRLVPRGIQVHRWDGGEPLPFEAETFDLVINRHADYDAAEVHRILRPGGRFISQQVGSSNNARLTERLLPGTPPRPAFTLEGERRALVVAGFSVEHGAEAFSRLRFFDVGAVVYFARIIEWEFPGFSVDACAQQLFDLERSLRADGWIESTEHRFVFVARKGGSPCMP